MPTPPQQRQFTRVGVAMEVGLRLPNGAIQHGTAMNLSLGGLFVATTPCPPLWSLVELTLRPADLPTSWELHATGQVLRHGPEGAAFLFVDMGVGDLQALVDVLVRNGLEPAQMVIELTRRLTLAPMPASASLFA